MNLVKDLSGIGKYQTELLNGVVVPLQTNIYHAFVIQVAEHIHGLCLLLERNGRALDHLESMLIALGFDAKFGELTMQGAAYWIRVS